MISVASAQPRNSLDSPTANRGPISVRFEVRGALATYSWLGLGFHSLTHSFAFINFSLSLGQSQSPPLPKMLSKKRGFTVGSPARSPVRGKHNRSPTVISSRNIDMMEKMWSLDCANCETAYR